MMCFTGILKFKFKYKFNVEKNGPHPSQHFY
jgi:hypothetical protein